MKVQLLYHHPAVVQSFSSLAAHVLVGDLREGHCPPLIGQCRNTDFHRVDSKSPV